MDRLLTPPEAKKILRVGLNRTYEIFARADFPAIHLGEKRLFVRESALLVWLEKQEKMRLDALSYVQLLFTAGDITKEGAENVSLDDAALWLESVREGELSRDQVVEKINTNLTRKVDL